MKIKKVKIADVKIGDTIRTPLLVDGFIERVQAYKKILADIEPTSIEETILNFQKDINPSDELQIWEHIALVYKGFIENNEKLTIEGKRDVFKVLLGISSGVENFELVDNLSREQVHELIKKYLNHD